MKIAVEDTLVAVEAAVEAEEEVVVEMEAARVKGNCSLVDWTGIWMTNNCGAFSQNADLLNQQKLVLLSIF